LGGHLKSSCRINICTPCHAKHDPCASVDQGICRFVVAGGAQHRPPSASPSASTAPSASSVTRTCATPSTPSSTPTCDPVAQQLHTCDCDVPGFLYWPSGVRHADSWAYDALFPTCSHALVNFAQRPYVPLPRRGLALPPRTRRLQRRRPRRRAPHARRRGVPGRAPRRVPPAGPSFDNTHC
jgi:hypothetical protein